VIACRLATFFMLGRRRSLAVGSGLLRFLAGSGEAGWAFLLVLFGSSLASSESTGSGAAEHHSGDSGRSTVGGA
jgi:hypothetical protein